MNARPCPPDLALARARMHVGRGGEYGLGHGGYDSKRPDIPWDIEEKLDCSGFAMSWVWEIPRNRPGFNHGAWSTVSDDINTASAVEDARHRQELYEIVTEPAAGNLLVYPTIVIVVDGHEHKYIGHVSIIESIARVVKWNRQRPAYSLLDIIHCKGGNGRRPAILREPGRIWDAHDAKWPKPEHRSVMLRVKQ